VSLLVGIPPPCFSLVDTVIVSTPQSTLGSAKTLFSRINGGGGNGIADNFSAINNRSKISWAIAMDMNDDIFQQKSPVGNHTKSRLIKVVVGV
jgi:hypothetical protein